MAVLAALGGCDDDEVFRVGVVASPAAQVSAGTHATCSIARGGSPAFCWGANETGQLGIGATAGEGDIRTVPTLVAGDLSFRFVSTGGEHSCALTDAGQAFCWGSNSQGQLGTTAALQTCSSTISAVASIPCSAAPVPVEGGLAFASITAGLGHTCGVTTRGQAFCWGDNSFGQLGTTGTLGTCTFDARSVPCARTPVPVAGGLTFFSISAGALSSHTCGVTTRRQAFCWGAAGRSQLGSTAALDACISSGGAMVPCARTPVPVAGGFNFASVSAGADFTCGVATTDQAFCWGSATGGQLGAPPPEMCDGQLPFPCARTPVAVAGGLRFAAVEAGSAHACGVTTANRAFCWGSNLNGAVGSTAPPESCVLDGSAFDCFTIPVQVAGDLGFQSVDAGDGYSCGITTNDLAFCWGNNEFGQLGDGTTTDRPTPVQVSSPVT